MYDFFCIVCDKHITMAQNQIPLDIRKELGIIGDASRFMATADSPRREYNATQHRESDDNIYMNACPIEKNDKGPWFKATADQYKEALKISKKFPNYHKVMDRGRMKPILTRDGNYCIRTKPRAEELANDSDYGEVMKKNH